MAGGSLVEPVGCISDLLLIERVWNKDVVHEIVLQGREVEGINLQNGADADVFGIDIGVCHGWR